MGVSPVGHNIQPGFRFGRLVVFSRGQQHFRLRNGTMRKDGWTWLCRCDCGKNVEIRSASLRMGATKSCARSCGCLVSENARKHLQSACAAWRLPAGEGALRAVLRQYKYSAKRRKLLFALSDEEARALFTKPCHYCGSAPSNISKGRDRNGDFVWNGIDRVDPARGYEHGNVVTACAKCNLAKQSLTGSEFLAQVQRIWMKSNPPLAAQA